MKVHQWSIHKKKIEFGQLLWCFAGIILVTAFHLIAGRLGGDFLMAVASRLYYIPVVYGAVRSGMVLGLVAGILTGLVHALIMISTHRGHDSAVMAEHIVAIPFLILLGLLTGVLRDHERHERIKREEVTEVFGRYVSHQVVEEILKKEINIEGEEMEATVLFSDLKNFAGFSEKLPPPELLRILNLYFTEMVDVILDYRGFLDKFIGDAVMAVFGVPIGHKNDAVRAVHAAIDMSRRLHDLNSRKPFINKPIGMRIGLHTGIVVAGNVGSQKRMEYTVIGDTVNLASRLESLNKKYGSTILISDATNRLIRMDDEIFAREIDAVRVKGRTAPCVIYEVFNCCPAGEIELKQRTLSEFSRALQFYKSGDFLVAEDAFRAVLDSYPEDRISIMYLDRLNALRRNPPENWDGVYEITDK